MKQRRFDVEVYEPAINPGGYYKHFIVPAPDPETAERAALGKAQDMWPDNKGLAVFRIQELTRS